MNIYREDPKFAHVVTCSDCGEDYEDDRPHACQPRVEPDRAAVRASEVDPW